jgi:SAM-dependent methyltransferase
LKLARIELPEKVGQNDGRLKRNNRGVNMKRDNASNMTMRLLAKAREKAKEEGIRYIVFAGIPKIINQLQISFGYYFHKILRSGRKFTFQGENYSYFLHEYNTTWKNERIVEIPIIWKIIKGYEEKKILEIGNVLSHYFIVNHDIVDKYEKAEGVITKDVTEFNPSKKYDLIICISTLEHVGWDENPRDHKIIHAPEKIMQALDNLKRALAPKGRLIVTLPVGYNLYLDRLLKNGKIQFNSQYCLKRISRDNKWIETSWNNVKDSKYNSPFPAANGLIIGIIKA